MGRLQRSIQREEFTLEGTGNAWATPVDLSAMHGSQGRIVHFKARLDTSDNNATDATFYVAEGTASPLTTTPDDLDVFYESTSGLSWGSGSATDAVLEDNPAASGGGYYSFTGSRHGAGTQKLTAGANVTGSGAWKFYCVVYTEVFN